uniref:G-protein coupled receptors family 1 profile domain-containing protein n=1 Tax=Acrobeloides nanus TaxID=290746 RepID=A0A914CB87_9BILA
MIDCNTEPLFPNIVMQSVLTIDYWILAGSYFGISILTCYAVRTPLKYKLSLTITRIVEFLVLGWVVIIGSLVGITLTTEQQTMFDSNGMMYMMRNQYHEHGSTLGHWMVGFCEIIMGKSVAQIGVISLVLPFLSYLTTLLSYAFVAILLFRRRTDKRVANRHQACVWRLGMHLGVFTISFVLMALAYFATFPMVDSCNSWSEYLRQRVQVDVETKICDISHLEAFMRYAILTSLSSIGWFLRMSLDPAIDMK